MRLDQMPGHNLPAFAVWPQPFYEHNLWFMYSLRLREDNSLHWYRRYIGKEGKANLAFSDIYADYTLATVTAMRMNKEMIDNIELLSIPAVEKLSLRLKVEKAVTAKSRLLNEEQLMLEIAIRNQDKVPKSKIEQLILKPEHEKFRESLFETLSKTPDIKIAYIFHDHILLTRKEPNDWSGRHEYAKIAAKKYYQEIIARGFGLSGLDHWGKTKSAIRSMLLPRANQLLELASVKRMLAEARMKGQKVLVVDGFVFWFEEHNQIGWVVKEASDSGSSSKGNTLWKEGTITSKNHGRIVVLPYVKENGEQVQGHTKNAPNDGKALPRHPNEYVELPFEVLEGDVMRGLFGELHYE
ncbi:TPA: hypothetical protein PXO86_004070 [Yersinia enterocolitica]|nr:hypothetical protein [Yersinia enterocolitica]